jgi:hypothetical protein
MSAKDGVSDLEVARAFDQRLHCGHLLEIVALLG